MQDVVSRKSGALAIKIYYMGICQWLLGVLCYRQGMTVEEIVQQYPHLRPADVHDAFVLVRHERNKPGNRQK